MVGISSNISNVKKRFFCDRSDGNYAYWGDQGSIYSKSKSKTYGKRYGTGDTLIVELDLTEKQLKFYVNDEYQGIAVKHLPSKSNLDYRLAVTMYREGHQISMKNFEKKYK